MQKLKEKLILSAENSDEMATVTFESTKNGVFGNIKTYNFRGREEFILGINNGNTVVKQNIFFNNGNTYSFKVNQISSLDNISCVLVKKSNEKYIPVLWGKKNNKVDSILQSFNDSYGEGVKINEVPKNDEKINADLFENDEKEIKEIIENELKDFDIQGIETEEKKEKPLNNKNTNIKKVIQEENEKLKGFNESEFFELISEQIEDLFDNYPRVTELEELISNSKSVKIDFENNGNEYVLGLIYDGFDLKYICYGVPGDFNSTPPKQLGECQWLPLDATNPKNGYWVIYQDASTGEKVDVI